jgi:hypothetical protein
VISGGFFGGVDFFGEKAGNVTAYILVGFLRLPPAALKKKSHNPRGMGQNISNNCGPINEMIRPLWAESKGFQHIS